MADTLTSYQDLLEGARTALRAEKTASARWLGRAAERTRDLFGGDPARRALQEMGVAPDALRNFRGSPREFLESVEASAADLAAQGVSPTTAREAALAQMQRDMLLAGRDNLGSQYSVVKDFRAAQRAEDPAVQRANDLQQRVQAELAAKQPTVPDVAAGAPAAEAPARGRPLLPVAGGVAAGGGLGYAAGTHNERGKSQMAQRRAFNAGLASRPRQGEVPHVPT